MFKGGIHLVDFKELSKDAKIEEFPYPEKVIIPLSQHTGSPAKPVVKRGDGVVEGDVIGEATGFISSYIHSSISGKVAGIEKFRLISGVFSPCVIIESDGEKRKKEFKGSNWLSLSQKQIIDIVREAGIVGLGGAAFPTSVKLSIPPGKKAEAVILNGCECEPFLTCDYRILKEKTDQVIEGLQIICKAVGVEKAYIGIEENKYDIVPIIREHLSNLKIKLDVEIKVLPTKYPQGSEKHLIKSITGREVPSGGLPIDVGCVVFNVQTAFAIKKAVCDGIPLTERVITVSGLVEKPKNLMVRIGTSVKDIIDFCGIKLTDEKKVVIGGPMMGIEIPDINVPVVKATTAILILPKEILPDEIEPCIRCGKCIDVCPMNLLPCEISRYAENEKWEICERLGVNDCIECGCCSYICPSKRPLVELFKWAKYELRKRKK